jgi:hypothetical protein
MNRQHKLILALAFGLSFALAGMGHWILGLVFLLSVETALAAPQARCCVNTLGTLATATIVQEALSLVFTKRPLLNRISLGFTDRNGSPIAQYNQSVITRTLAIPTVGNLNDAAVARADVDVSVTLNNFKQLRYDFTSAEYSGTNRDLIREAAEPMATAMANYMVDAVAALWTTTNFPTRTGADAVANSATNTLTKQGAGWDYTFLLQQRAILNKAGVPQFKRWFAGNCDVYASMLNDQRIVAALYNGQNGDAISRGQMPEVAGFGIDEYPSIPANSINLIGACGTPDSVVYAQRVPSDPRSVPGMEGVPLPGRIGIVTEPRTGLSVMVVEYIAMPSLAITCMLLWMYGVAKGNTNNLQLIASQ